MLQGGRVIDPLQDLDGVMDVRLADKVVAVETDLHRGGTEVRNVSDKIIIPGLIDLQTHVYWDGTSLSVDADAYARSSAVKTCVDTGSVGSGDFAGFRKHVIEPNAVRILAYLHASYKGTYAFSNRVMPGESHDIHLMDARDTVEVADASIPPRGRARRVRRRARACSRRPDGWRRLVGFGTKPSATTAVTRPETMSNRQR